MVPDYFLFQLSNCKSCCHGKAKTIFFIFLLALSFACQESVREQSVSVKESFLNPPYEARSWVIWYWMRAAVSAEGITADLEAMKEAGIAGAYLMPIKGADNPPLFEPAMIQLTPEWWVMVRHAFNEADRLGLKLALHACDGFALSGGPWITPEMSMQKVVWADTIVHGGSYLKIKLPQPQIKEGFYRDIALYAYPTPEGAEKTTRTVLPDITTSTGANASFLIIPGNRDTFRSDEPCWIQYQFEEPFTCRTIYIGSNGNDVQAQRFIVEVSNDGETFQSLGRLEVPRHGWQDTDAQYTHSIEPVTAKYFRFTFDPQSSEPGAEDFDAAKWRPNLRLSRLELSGEPRIHHYEGKAALGWRIASETKEKQVSKTLCVDPKKMMDLTGKISEDGLLEWDVPVGNWTLLRMGHTSTGHTNYTAGGGLGLEVDKFNPVAVKFQFDQWFGKAVEMVGEDLASRVLKIFHLDSWECGSQNWTANFPQEFRKRRKYDMMPFLPSMAGIPVKSAADSEKFLKDVRQTISELMLENFFNVYQKEANEMGFQFSAENVSPTMTSDGMLHFQSVDIPMGEFWLRSPTHDKPNDMLDAISGAHIYGKNIVKVEAFTQLRMAWDEHPAMLKTLGDRNYALGFNKFAYHVFTHNPWIDRKPGMTLDPIGLFFQRDQTWWKPGKAWVDYAARCQALLQQGSPVVDIAVFTGEQIPRRSVLPDRLMPFLPGIFGEEKVEAERLRLQNDSLPIREMPRGVFHSANIADPEKWIDPLRGYAYDSFNPDALLRLAKVENGRMVLPSGASYAILVMPGIRRMNPEGNVVSGAVMEKIYDMVEDGLTVIFGDKPIAGDKKARYYINEIFKNEPISLSDNSGAEVHGYRIKDGLILIGPYELGKFKKLGVDPDFMAYEDKIRTYDLAWTHRRTSNKTDIYFVSNQLEEERTLTLSFRVKGKVPDLYNPVTGEIKRASEWEVAKDRTSLTVKLPANGSLFVVFEEPVKTKYWYEKPNWTETEELQVLDGAWELAFDPLLGAPDKKVTLPELKCWTTFPEPGLKYYSGTAVYKQTFHTDQKPNGRVWLNLGNVANIAKVRLNGSDCGVAWTFPFEVEVTNALQQGENHLEIEVTNTWANRMMGDQLLPVNERITWTTAPYVLAGKPLLEAGLLGKVTLQTEIE